MSGKAGCWVLTTSPQKRCTPFHSPIYLVEIHVDLFDSRLEET